MNHLYSYDTKRINKYLSTIANVWLHVNTFFFEGGGGSSESLIIFVQFPKLHFHMNEHIQQC